MLHLWSYWKIYSYQSESEECGSGSQEGVRDGRLCPTESSGVGKEVVDDSLSFADDGRFQVGYGRNVYCRLRCMYGVKNFQDSAQDYVGGIRNESEDTYRG